MDEVQCLHCGLAHPTGTRFCSTTGRPLPQAVTPQPPSQYAAAPPQGNGQPHQTQPPAYAQQPYPQQPPAYAQQPYPQQPPPYAQSGYGAPQAQVLGAGKPVGTIITEAFQLYQKHLVTLLVTCAILVVPVSLAKSAALALILAPAAVVDVAAKNTAQFSRQTAEQWQRQFQEAQHDPKKLQQLAQERQKDIQDLSRALATTGTVAVGGFMAWIVGFVAMLFGIAVMYGVAIPLVTGALTIVVADRATGGSVGAAEAYKLLFMRLGKFLSAWIPAFVLILIGLCFLVIPGLIIGFLFSFVAPVVLLENVGGIAALKRSVSLVKANVPQVAVVGLVFAGIRIVASLVTHLFVPSSAFFFDSLVQDALLLFLLPVPIIGTVLLYLDIRRQADGLDERGVRTGIDGLRRS